MSCDSSIRYSFCDFCMASGVTPSSQVKSRTRIDDPKQTFAPKRKGGVPNPRAVIGSRDDSPTHNCTAQPLLGSAFIVQTTKKITAASCKASPAYSPYSRSQARLRSAFIASALLPFSMVPAMRTFDKHNPETSTCPDCQASRGAESR